MLVPTLASVALLFSVAVESAEVCKRSFYIEETIDMFANYTDLVSFEMDCSQPRVPALTVTVEPPLREQIEQENSKNGKVAYSIKCINENNVTVYSNRSNGVKKSEPWTIRIPSSVELPLGQNCSIIGCFWDYFEGPQRRHAVQGSACITNLNECLQEPHVCEQLCVDTFTGYECSCLPGYQLENDLHNCTDVDECYTGTHLCSHDCFNTNSSYTCSCPDGYVLGRDNIMCHDVDECTDGSARCEQECMNTNGSFVCSCREGFELDDNQISCKDIDECDPTSGYEHHCDHTCNNTNGSYVCSCNPGYILSSDQYKCYAIGECEHPDPCSQLCVNNTGVVYCQCHSGYTLSDDGTNCTANPSTQSDALLVLYMPWAVPLAFTFALILISLFIYYSIVRRMCRKQGHVLETNPDLYDFFLTQEKLDSTYEPVDLTGSLHLDSDTFKSETTSLHSASSIEKAESFKKTQLLFASHNPPFNSGKEEVHTVPNSGGHFEKNDTDISSSQEMAPECNVHIRKFSSHDSCIGSSIAGETSSSLQHTSNILCTSDVSDTSIGQTVDTSVNSDYIATNSQPQGTTSTHSSSKRVVNVTNEPCALDEEDESDTIAIAVDLSKHETLENHPNKEEKDFSKTKDYIHATNALFTVADAAI